VESRKFVAARKFSSAVGSEIFIHQTMELERATSVCSHQHAYTLHTVPKSITAKTQFVFYLGGKWC